MIIIHVIKALPRLVGAALAERMRVMPAVVVTGARQTGKSTFSDGSSRAHGAMPHSTISMCSMPPGATRRCLRAVTGR
jgi:phage/plasmid-associated DNA primase